MIRKYQWRKVVVDYVYDLETYQNIWTFCAANVETKEVVVFEISDRKDERQKLLSYLRKLYVEKARMVGFNNISFDYPILHYLLKNQTVTVKQLYAKAKSIIEAQDEDKFANLVKAKDVLIPQIDLYKIHHFDNRAKSTSLKMIEFNMRSETIEDLPFEVGTKLSNKEKDVLIEYNKHDVLKTVDFYFASLDKIKFREELTEKHGRDFINHNDTKIGKDYFIMKLEEVNPEACYSFNGKRRMVKQTKRDIIPLNDCIFPYIKFERPEFNAVLNWFKTQKITETKGVFSDLREDQLGDVAKYAEMDVKKIKLFKQPTPAKLKELQTKYPSGKVVEVPLKSGKTSLMWCWNQAENLNVVVDGFRFDFGTGGIHGSLSTSIVVADEEWQIVDLDVNKVAYHG